MKATAAQYTSPCIYQLLSLPVYLYACVQMAGQNTNHDAGHACLPPTDDYLADIIEIPGTPAVCATVPSNGSRLPLLVFAPGIGNSWADYNWLAATPELVVARLEKTTHHSMNAMNVSDLIIRIRQRYREKVSDKVIIAGHSYGAYSAFMAVGQTVKLRLNVVLFLLAPPMYYMHLRMGCAGYGCQMFSTKLHVPILTALGTQDCVVPDVSLEDLSSLSLIVRIQGGNHRFWTDAIEKPQNQLQSLAIASSCVTLSRQQQHESGKHMLSALGTGSKHSPFHQVMKLIRSSSTLQLNRSRYALSCCCCEHYRVWTKLCPRGECNAENLPQPLPVASKE